MMFYCSYREKKKSFRKQLIHLEICNPHPHCFNPDDKEVGLDDLKRSTSFPIQIIALGFLWVDFDSSAFTACKASFFAHLNEEAKRSHY